MNIAIDVSPIQSENLLAHRVRGTGFYIKNLKKFLLQYYPENKYTFFTREQKIPENTDIVHYPYFEPFFLTLPFLKKHKTIVTVHDLTPLVFKKYFPSGIRGKIKWNLQKMSLNSAKAIITDSQSSKKDIINFTDIKDEKTHVVYLAASEEFKKNKISNVKDQIFRKKYNLPNKFALYVGDVTWNKNLPRLIEAIKKIDIPLVMVGHALDEKDIEIKNPWNQDLAKVRTLTANDKNIFILGFIPQEDLVTLYNIATVFTMPSLYEGFGLPILEAMSCGCPVVTTKKGSLAEVAGDAAYFVDAYDVDSIASGIKKVFLGESVQGSLYKKGLIRARKFNWKKTIDDTILVYRKVAGK